MSTSEDLPSIELLGLAKHVKRNTMLSASDDFEVLSNYHQVVSNTEEHDIEFKKKLFKLSFLHHSKRAQLGIESYNIRNYFFRLLNKSYSDNSTLVKTCMDFLLCEEYPNRIILEFNKDGLITRYYTNMVGFNDLGIINKKINTVFVDLSFDEIFFLVGKYTYSVVNVIPGNIQKAYIQVHSTNNSPEYFLLLRY